MFPRKKCKINTSNVDRHDSHFAFTNVRSDEMNCKTLFVFATASRSDIFSSATIEPTEKINADS